MNLSILSQNIWNENYYWEKRKPLIISLINEFDPDIIGFQEVKGKSITNNQLTEIASKLKDYNFQFTLAKKAKGNVYGMGLMSKGEILNTTVFKLHLDPRETKDNFPRILSHHKIKYKDEVINILHTHLCFGSTGRKANIKQTFNYVRQRVKGKYTILLGDFQTSPTEPELESLLQLKFNNRQFMDMGNLAKNTKATWPISQKLVKDNWKRKNLGKKLPWKISPQRMDLVLSLGKPSGFSYKLVYKKKKGIYHSDHCGVFVDLEYR